MKYDLLGRRTELKDPNAGTITYEYDGWGNLKKQTDARGEAEEYVYDGSGRLQTYKRGAGESFSYTYDSNYKGLVSSIVYGGVKTTCTYGTYGRLDSRTETIDNKSFRFSYSYNNKGQLETMTYPNSKSIKYEYTNGDLYKIIWQPTVTTIWQKSDANAKGQILSVNSGNSIQNNFTYNTIRIPTSIQAIKGTSTLFNVAYRDIDSRGNIQNRHDFYKSQGEYFTYDGMNRLTSGVEYSENGNITFKSDAGTYQYAANHPHAVNKVSPGNNMGLANTNLLVTYNSVRLPVKITENNKVYTISYNGGNSRIKSQYVENNATVFTKYYSGPYEEIQKGSTTRKNYYIYAGGEIAAVYTEGASDAGMYYFHNDHLGSPWLITNASGNEVQRLNFNAWGRRRDASNWNNYTNLPEMKFDRGFTGHEHLEMFGLINMNARLYDPVLGRFLSPDPLVQVPDFTQSYNGYSYALNNPLSYKDPNGESLILAAAIIGGWIGMGTAMVSSDKSGWGLAGDMFKGLFVGAASGAAGAWAGGAVAGSITSLGFVQGSLSGMAGGFSSGFVGCAGNAWLAGAGFGQGLKAGLIGGGFGAAVSGLIGGINGAIQYRKQMTVFTRGVEALGLEGGGEVPATDGFLLDAQKVWYKDAPMESINKFTVEHVPADIQAAMDAGNAPGATRFLHKGGVLTGRSNIYFNKNLAFTSAKQLYYAMGHELLHASQFAALAGQSASLMNQHFIFGGNPVYFNHDLLEFHAYSYQYSLGGAQLNSFSSGLVKAMAKQWPSYFNKLGAINFNWTTNSNYKYPF